MEKFAVISIDITQLNKDNKIIEIVELPSNVYEVSEIRQFDTKGSSHNINKLVLLVKTEK